jgi:Leucine-rich repeat (LRR) protein
MSDRETVASIFAGNNLEWDIDNRATFNRDRVIALDLTNGDISISGITQLNPEIGNLTELRVLTINDGQILTLPVEIFNCTKLTRLEIKNSNLKFIPLGLSKLTELKELDLRNNELELLPLDIGELKSIFKIQLWGNNLILLPPEIGNLITLRELYLNHNRLTKLPDTITKLTLTYLDISFNYLQESTTSVDLWLKKYDKQYLNEQFGTYKGNYF